MTDDCKTNVENNVPTVPIRQNLVNTAVNFLLNPDVKVRSSGSKVAFLQKKGLTEPEITAALDQANYNVSCNSISNPQSNVVRYPVPYHQKPYSFWSQLSRVSSSVAVIAVALYGLHRLYKIYIEPWLFGIKSESARSREMEALVAELNASIWQLKNSVSALEQTVGSQKEQIEAIFVGGNTGYKSIPMAVEDLKTDIGSLKSLLINRHQFPAVPKVATPSIPQWQLRSSENSESESKSNNHQSPDAASSETESPETLQSKITDLKTKEDEEVMDKSSLDLHVPKISVDASKQKSEANHEETGLNGENLMNGTKESIINGHGSITDAPTDTA